MARFTPDGSPDPLFGTGGFVVTDIQSGSDDSPDGLVIDAQDRIVACGYSFGDAPGTMALARYLGSPAWAGNTASVVVSDEVAYQVGSAAGAGYLRLIGVTDPSTPVVLSETFHPSPLCDLDGARDVCRRNHRVVVAESTAA
ncbi:MAG: hypothetical protein H7A48_06200 [Akkermansiaceae bacterium]|nr:hypothetical protein [Akkermansiaceae bacterium]